MEKNEILAKLFSGNQKLPTLPVIFDKLNQMLKDPNTSNKKIADLMMKDPAMVTKVLKLCNSAMYSKRKEITNLANAITFLGMNRLKTLILQISLVKIFELSDENIPDFKINTFWEHSLGTAYFTTLVTRKLKIQADDNYYIAGLLHDIGKLVVYQFYPDKFKEIIKKQIAQKLIDIIAEESVLGVNHNEIGGFLAEKWQFQPEIIEAIKEHHNHSTSQTLLTAIVQISNLFAKASGLCFPWDSNIFAIVGDPNWEIIAQHSENVDIDALVQEVMEESNSVREAVKELLSK